MFSGNMAGARCAITALKTSQLFILFSKLLVVVLGWISVDKLVSVENEASAPLRD